MSNQYDLTLEQPVSIWNKPLDLPIKELFKSLGKATVAGVFADSKGLYENLVEASSVLGFEKNPQQAAWVLVFKSLQATLCELVPDYQDLFECELDDTGVEALSDNMAKQLNDVPLGITPDFFDYPENLSLFTHIKPAITFWLESLGMRAQDAEGFFARLKQSFALALHKEWHNNREDYLCVAEHLQSPFASCNKEQRGWHVYNVWLQEQVNQRMFAEAFSLSQVYVNLNAYYKVAVDNDEQELLRSTASNTKKQVVDLHAEINNWAIQFNKACAIKVISGGPGSGKSSFAKMFAATMVRERPEIRVVFIPLHHFDPSDDLLNALARYVESDPNLPTNPLNKEQKTQRVLLIFDGLDELAMQGKLAAETANHFVEEVISKINRFNDAGFQWQALITGREMAVQSVAAKLRGLQQLLYVLPYFVEQDEDTDDSEYIDPEKLLATDLRDTWWQNYGRAKGASYEKLPEQLAISQLQPITQEPLLNYLVALSFERGEVVFDEHLTLNQIYQDLLDAVYHRQWDHGGYKQTRDLEKPHFIRVLEEIALAVWHGNGRVASISKIQQQCESSRVTKYLEVFQESATSGISRLLTAFYFRQSELLDGQDKTFEFTHKSFGEYLIARRIVREVAAITSEVNRNIADPDVGYDQISAKARWAKLSGPTALDEYIFNFLVDEVSLRHIDDVQQWQTCFAGLFSRTLRKGMPVEELQLATFSEMQKYARNAEVALLAIHHACGCATEKVADLNLENGYSLSQWLLRVKGSGEEDDRIPARCFTHIDLQQCSFEFKDLRKANLQNSNLNEAIFIGGYLAQVRLQGVSAIESSWWGASLSLANASYANFANAKFDHTKMLHCVLKSACFEGAVFYRADLFGSTLINANLTDANLTNANLTNANLTNADLTNADLTNADLTNADLTNADLTNAILDHAKLREATLKGTVLIGVDLSKVDLSDVDLSEAILE
ncbi:pentapeptide repeat-containing protein [Pseudoalteromonas sp. MMG022]|uniref:pentapeptide repeat-containing protein n=1 Tax=Pseudoalteromonas sp. MMG022 TaxID=2909978 RepID=UPI001F30B155|nr:pentapeptide repeat-containing protein [Pseudoalteromonas sp. MMG022]MCF6436336.1 pentapeptide repeat-containing protein [Pseudoalteromonas sp. MMG022]